MIYNPLDLTDVSTPAIPKAQIAVEFSDSDTSFKTKNPLLRSDGSEFTEDVILGVKQASGYVEEFLVELGGINIVTNIVTWTTRGLPKRGGFPLVENSDLVVALHKENEEVFVVETGIKDQQFQDGLTGEIEVDILHRVRPEYGATAIGAVPVFADAAARDAAITSPQNGDECYLTAEGIYTDYKGGAWVERGDTGTPNASTTVAGKGQVSTTAKADAADDSGSTGAINWMPPSQVSRVVQNSKYTYATAVSSYTPALLTSGTNAQGTFGTWEAVTDGSFRITIDGVAYNIDAIDFTGDGSMADVAATIQAAIRTATSALETCVWSTDHFIISSVDTTSSSAITVTDTSTGTVGTDISGAGASDWMDADTGNGVVTDKVHASYNVTLIPAITAYATGQEFEFLTDVANAGAFDVNFSALGDKDCFKFVDQELELTDTEAGQVIKVKYDGTSFQMLSPLASTPTTAQRNSNYGGPTTNNDANHTHTASGSFDAGSETQITRTTAGTTQVTISGLSFQPKYIKLHAILKFQSPTTAARWTQGTANFDETTLKSMVLHTQDGASATMGYIPNATGTFRAEYDGTHYVEVTIDSVTSDGFVYDFKMVGDSGSTNSLDLSYEVSA